MLLTSKVDFLPKLYLLLVLTEFSRNPYFTWNFLCSPLFGLQTKAQKPQKAGTYSDLFLVNLLSAELSCVLFGSVSPQILEKETLSHSRENDALMTPAASGLDL